MGLFDAGEHAVTQYGLRSSSFYASYLLYDCEPVLLGKAGFAKSPAQEIAAHKQFVQKENGHYHASTCKADISYDHCTKVVPQVIYKLYF